MAVKKSDFNKLMSLTKESLAQLSLFDVVYFQKNKKFNVCFKKDSEQKVIKETFFKGLSSEEITQFLENLPFDPKMCNEKLMIGVALHRYCNPNHIYMVIQDAIFKTESMIYFLLREDKKLKKYFAHKLKNNPHLSLYYFFIKSDNYVSKKFTYFTDDVKSTGSSEKALYPIHYWVKHSKLLSYNEHLQGDTMFRFNDIRNNKTVCKFYFISPPLVDKVVSTQDKSKIILSKL